jgi:hypothetical protein
MAANNGCMVYNMVNENLKKNQFNFAINAPTFENIQKNGLMLQNVKEQTNYTCMTAVKQNGNALYYVHNQTEDICLAAVQQDGLALRYVKKQTEDICLAAVKQNGLSLRHIKEQTKDICLAAIKQNVNAFHLIDRRYYTYDIYMEVVKKDGTFIKNLNMRGLLLNQKKNIYNAAVLQNGLALKYIQYHTDDICEKAVQQNGMALQFINEQTPEICLLAVQQNGMALKYVNEQTFKICLAAIKQNGCAIKYININKYNDELFDYIMKMKNVIKLTDDYNDYYKIVYIYATDTINFKIAYNFDEHLLTCVLRDILFYNNK